ncbi:MAG: patatin-like phospholipase family protein [Calditrichaceae bacterium]|nr:patatin-like phospholipase family protein [Calditrichaceae bacterium]MBN2707716.1 patatin-like phospholipase family protein [Calditrichaceae bacterium]RQV96468.1 MAG: patatin [Calditrichota bacterium]
MRLNFFRKKYRKNKKLGLALGGGAVLGAAHIGVLKAFEESDLTISYITGTSIGALIAAFCAFNKSSSEIEKIAKDINWPDISSISLSQFGLLSNEKLGKLIIENIGNVNIEDAAIPLSVIATDIANGQKVILKKGKLKEAVMASACIPGIFIPVEIDNKLLVDGGIVENVPTITLKNMGADYIVGVDLNAGNSHKKPDNIIEVLLNTFDFTIMTATKLQTAKANIIIKPGLSAFNMIDTDQVPDLIDAGYQEAVKVIRKMV